MSPCNRIHPTKVLRSEVFILLLSMSVIMWVSAGASAQTSSTGALSGKITDPSGAVVPGAQVKLTSEATGETRTVSSQATGVYLIPLLAPGSYRLEVQMKGFKLAAKPGVQINVTETATLNLRLEVGSPTDVVTVEATSELVQTTSSTLGRVTDQKAIESLPMVTRNFSQIMGLSPGIATSVTNASELGAGSGTTSGTSDNVGTFVHGARSYDNNFQLNGMNVSDPMSGGTNIIPNPDAIQEFKVQTGQYDASFGRNAGANVNLVTKSGSNQFYGSLFEFFRNEDLNANDFFSNKAGQERGVLRQNQFGLTVGGPVVKDKLLFFGSYQGTRQVNGIAPGGYSAVSLPPLTNDRSPAGIGKIYAGQRGYFQNLFGGVGPAIAADGSNINPIALKILQYKLPNGQYFIPTPQTVNPSLPLDSQGFSVFSAPSTYDSDQYMVNVDYLVTAKNKLSARFFTSGSDTFLPLPPGITFSGQLPGTTSNSHGRPLSFSLAHGYSASARMFNEAQFGYMRTSSITDYKTPFSFSDLGITSSPQNNTRPAFSLSTFGFGAGTAVNSGSNIYQFNDSLSYTKGRHSIRVGGSLVRSIMDVKDYGYPGAVDFLTFPDFLLGLNGSQNGTFGLYSNVYLAFDLLGLMGRSYRDWDVSAYAQDDIQLNSRLTLNLGVRYEYMGGIADALGRNGNFYRSLANPNPPATGTVAGFVVSSNFKGTLPAGVTQLDNEFGNDGNGKNNFGPRVGFAWQVLPNSKRIVLRGGYGMYNSRPKMGIAFQTITTPPFSALRLNLLQGTPTLANPFVNPIPSESDFPIFKSYSPTTSLSLNSIDQNYRPQLIQQWSMNLQSEIARDLLLEVGYVGTRGQHLIRSRDADQAGLASASNPIRGITTNTLANIAQRRPILGFSRLLVVESAGNSWYHGLEASLTKRFSHGLQFLASYTFSRAFDTDGVNVSMTSVAGGTTGDQNNSSLRYGPSSFNREQRIVFSFVYALPELRNGPQFAKTMLKGWSLSGLTTIQSGHRLTLTYNNSNNVFGTSADRATLASGCTYSQLATQGSVTSRLNGYFNAACLTTPPVIGDDGKGTGFGNTGVGIVRGPAQNNFDLAVIKRITIRRTKVGEGLNLEFRSEFFNVFNTPQFMDPDTTFGGAGFGTITGTSVSPRIIQFALKLNF